MFERKLWKKYFLFVRASSANSKFRLFFSGFEVRCLWWCWRAVQRLFLLLKSSGRVYYDCYYYPKGVGKEKGTGRGRYREKRPHGRETLTPSSVVTILNSKDSFLSHSHFEWSVALQLFFECFVLRMDWLIRIILMDFVFEWGGQFSFIFVSFEVRAATANNYS